MRKTNFLGYVLPFIQRLEYNIPFIFYPVDGVISHFIDIEKNERIFIEKSKLRILVSMRTKDIPPIP